MAASGQVSVVLALSLLLTAGFAVARLAKLVHLPSVTGYIIAGALLGPVGVDLVGRGLSPSRLEVFTSIALMLVAFSIGERFDLQQLRHSADTLVRVSAGECGATFLLVGLVTGGVAWATKLGGESAGPRLWVALAAVCASIAVATAPAATVAVLRELEATGPVSRLVLSCVVVNNALSVTLFGMGRAAARGLLGTSSGSGLIQALQPLLNTVASLVLGVAVGWLTDVIVHRLSRRSEVLVVALAAVFMCGGLAEFLGLSSLLAGVAAGFAVVNRDRRDVRAFRALNDFEPPLYGIFFALAGAQVHLNEMATAGLLGLAFVLARAAGKYVGAWLGARSADMEPVQSTNVGLGLLPQAGLAIGLAYLVRQDPSLAAIRTLVINVVIASVVINELVGPPLVRIMALRVGELPETTPPAGSGRAENGGFELVPWSWPKIAPAAHPRGYVVVGVSHPDTAAGVTRIATLLSHYYGALPLAVHVETEAPQLDFWTENAAPDAEHLFEQARTEALALGYPLHTESELAEDVVAGILHAVQRVETRALVLGHPFTRRTPAFLRIVDAVARGSECPVVMVKLTGVLHTERILVPISSLEEAAVIQPVVSALALVSEHQLTLLQLVPHESGPGERKTAEQRLCDVLGRSRLSTNITCETAPAESRVHAILSAAENHDIVVMAASDRVGLRRLFFGSLAEDVAQQVERPMLLVRGGNGLTGRKNANDPT